MQVTGTIVAIVVFLELRRWRWLSGPAALIGTVAVVLSYSRSASIVLAITALVLVVHYRRTSYFPLTLMTGCLAAAAVVPFVPEEYWARMATLLNFNSDYTLWRRFGYNLIGLDLLKAHPLFGVGPGNFEYYYVQSEYSFYPGRTLLPRRLHNMYLSIAVEYGLVGFITFMGLHVTALRAVWRARWQAAEPELRGLATAISFAYVAYLLGSLFIPSEYAKYTWLMPGLAVAIGRLAIPSALPERAHATALSVAKGSPLPSG
jgi:O-antigen ligase